MVHQPTFLPPQSTKSRLHPQESSSEKLVPPSDSERSEADFVQDSSTRVKPIKRKNGSDSEMSFIEQADPVVRRSVSPESDIPSAQPHPSSPFPPALSPRDVLTRLPEVLLPSPSVTPSTEAAAVSDSARTVEPTGHQG